MIEINDLTKDYGEKRGIFDLSFDVKKGEVFGFLGPNGAGKTTTIRHLMGFLRPDKGECFIDDLDCFKQASKIKEKLGYLPGEIAFFNTMTGTEFIHFMAEMRGMKDKGRIKSLLDFFELDPSGRIRKMSKGMKQKIGLVCAFMHDPEVLILDEPTSGLDPLMQSKFIQLVLHEKSRGKTILMSSHSFEEVERTCDRVGIIKTGRLVAVDSVASIKEQSHKVYRVMFSSKEEARTFAKECVGASLLHSGMQVEVHIPGTLKHFIAAMGRYNVTGLDVVSQDLEDIFMQYYGGENNVQYPVA